MYSLVGVDGNAFAIMAYVSRALRETDLCEEVKEYMSKATSGNYDNLLSVSIEYIDKANAVAENND